MHIEIHRDAEVFDRLGAEWNRLLAGSATHVPFLRAEYLKAWWHWRGGGEWPAAELLVAAAREPGGELIGVAPLFHVPQRSAADPRAALLLAGSIEISDYLDVIVRAPEADDFCTALVERLKADDVPAWDMLDLYNLPAATPTRAALARAAVTHGLHLSEQLLEPVPVISLPGDWETYLATQVAKKERQEIRRKIRRAEATNEAVRWYAVDGRSGQDPMPEVEAFLDLMALNPSKASFLTPAMREQFRLIARTMADCGWLRLAVLEVNGAKAAAYMTFDYGNRLWVYNSALDPRYMALSPGWVLLGYLLQWAIAHGREAFDFLRGAEDYKLRFGAVPGQIYRVQISRTAPPLETGGSAACLMDEFEGDFFPSSSPKR